MKNKKGFTLVELLAVIVVLAIIMVIAATSVTNAMKTATVGSFVNSYKMLMKDIKQRIVSNELGGTAQITCDDNAVNNECYKIYEYSKDEYSMSVTKDPNGNYIFSLTGQGKFADVKNDDIKDELPEGTTSFGENKEKNILVFDSNANVITEDSVLGNILETQIKEESKRVTFEYFDLITEHEEYFASGNPNKKTNNNLVFISTGYGGICDSRENPKYSITVSLNVNRLHTDDSAVFTGDVYSFGEQNSDLFNTYDIVDYYKKIDLQYIDEYREDTGKSLYLTYPANTDGTIHRKYVTRCYTDNTYTEEKEPLASKNYSLEGIKHFRTIDLENKVLKDLQ